MQSTTPRTLTGGEAIARALADEGLEYFFNLPGNGVYPMLDPLLDYPIQYRLALHEASLVAIADGYARASGKVPFVNLYMVPGTSNALSSIYIASRDKVPLVITSTQQQTSVVGRDAYASAPDLLGMVRQYTKWCWEVTAPERLPEAIHRAFKIAATYPQGPVFLSMPFNFFREPVHGPLNEPSRPSAVPSYGPPPAQVVQAIADRLVSAERVLLVCGKDVVDCDAVAALETLAREVGAAVVWEPWTGVVAFPSPHDLGFGLYTRETFDRLAPTLVFGVGARMFAEAVGAEPGFPAGTQVVNLGLDPTEMGRLQPSDVSGVGDVGLGLLAVLDAVRGRIEPARRAARLDHVAAYQAEVRAERDALLRENYDNAPMSIPRLATELNRVLTPDTLLVEYGTSSTDLLLKYLDLPNPRHYFGTGSSTQGWGTPAAIGVQLARPHQRVLAIVGDGGFAFTCQSLWTAARYGIPVTVLVLNNQGYRGIRGTISRTCERAIAQDYAFDVDFEVDVQQVARGFGVAARRVEDPAAVAEAVRDAMHDDRPEVVEVVISPRLPLI